MLADAGGRFTDRPFPGRGGAVNRAAGLLLAKIADLIEDPDDTLAALPVPRRGATTSASCWPGSTRRCRRPGSCKSWPGPPPDGPMMPNGGGAAPVPPLAAPLVEREQARHR